MSAEYQGIILEQRRVEKSPHGLICILRIKVSLWVGGSPSQLP